MTPQDLIPHPDTISVHWGWFQFLLILTFVLHLFFMNAMLGTGIICLVREFITPDTPDDLNQEMSKKMPYTIALAVNMGVAPLLFLQVLYGHFMYTSSILMAVYWLSLVLLIIIAYYCIYIYDFKFDALEEARKIFIVLGVILLLWVGFIFSNNMTLMIQPEKWHLYFTNPFGTLLNLSEPMLVPRYLHFVTASVAVGGLFQAIVWHFKPGTPHAALAIRSGLTWFTRGTMVQFMIGIWFLAALPKEKMMLFMGGAFLPTLMLICGIILGLAAIFFGVKQQLWAATGSAAATIVVMVLVRDLLRGAYLQPYFSPASLKVIPEYSPMIMFLASLVAGIVIIVYMLKLAVSDKEGLK